MRSLLLLLLPLPLATARAQADWTPVHQPALWVNAFIDHGITPKLAFWFDGHWRRDDLGTNPQQLLLRPGVQFALRPNTRLGAGYGYIATAPYGEVPLARPLREHRAFQQLTIANAVGRATVSNRIRLEQRWVGALDVGDEVGRFTYQARIRHFVRAQRPLAGRLSSKGPMLGFVANEFFLPIGHSDGDQGRYQNRAQVGVGFPMQPGQRLELSYLHQWSRITPRSTNEYNHTMVLSWYWTKAAPH